MPACVKHDGSMTSIDGDGLTIPDPSGGIDDADHRRDAVFPCHSGSMGRHASGLGYQC